MKKNILMVLVLMLISSRCNFGESLNVSNQESTTPRKVQITSPSKIIEKSGKVFSKWGGCEFFVDWGDGESLDSNLNIGDKCSLGLVHTFQKPGTYTIKAQVYHLNPDDSLKIDWSGQTIINIP